MGIFRKGKGKDEAVLSFETITLRLSGMRGAREYEIVRTDDKAEITEYEIRYAQGEDKRVPERRAVCGAEEMLALLNRCAFLSWDGFHGPHPKNVRDGTMFRLTATVNTDKAIHADGSENFPKHFRDFTDALYALLRNAETETPAD